MRTPLAEVERLNGVPFQLNYFDGDYSGAIASWRGGRFDRPLLSSGAALRAAKPVIASMLVSFPE